MYFIQHCLICCPSDFTVWTVATSALAVRRSNHMARYHPQLGWMLNHCLKLGYFSSPGSLGAVAHDHDPPPALPHLHHQHAHLCLQRQLHTRAGSLSKTGRNVRKSFSITHLFTTYFFKDYKNCQEAARYRYFPILN
jgi:hypothetical protein